MTCVTYFGNSNLLEEKLNFPRKNDKYKTENEVLKDKTTIGHNYNRSHRFVLWYKWVSAVACNIHWLLRVTLNNIQDVESQMMKPTRGSLPWVHHLKYFDRFIGYRTRQVKVKVIIKNKFPGGDLVAGWQNYYENYRVSEPRLAEICDQSLSWSGDPRHSQQP